MTYKKLCHLYEKDNTYQFYFIFPDALYRNSTAKLEFQF